MQEVTDEDGHYFVHPGRKGIDRADCWLADAWISDEHSGEGSIGEWNTRALPAGNDGAVPAWPRIFEDLARAADTAELLLQRDCPSEAASLRAKVKAAKDLLDTLQCRTCWGHGWIDDNNGGHACADCEDSRRGALALPQREAGEPVRPLPGELAMIQIAMETLRHIANYSPVSRIQPVMIARDALKKIAELTFESEPVASLASPPPIPDAPVGKK